MFKNVYKYCNDFLINNTSVYMHDKLCEMNRTQHFLNTFFRFSVDIYVVEKTAKLPFFNS